MAQTPCPTHGPKYIGPAELRQVDVTTGKDVFVANPKAGQCYACLSYNEKHGRGKAQPIKESKPHVTEYYPAATDNFDEKNYRKWLNGVMDDPIRLAAFMADGRRPTGVSRERHGIAIRRAAHEPMLNASKNCVQHGLLTFEKGTNGHIPKGRVFRYLLVKPNSIKAARDGRGWHAREWVIYTLKYAKGLIIVTNRGEESKVFNRFPDIREAILKSDWEIIR